MPARACILIPVSLEGETGIIANNIRSIDGATIDGNASFANVPFLANVRIEPHHFGRFSTYIGGGLGGSAAIISAEHHIDLGGTTMHGDQGAVVFAYQAFAGIKYAFAPNMDVGLEYHYLATTGPTWKADNTFGTAGDEMRLAGVTSHMLSAAFTFRF
jgi:opacity protein-like surface antigen